MSKHTSTNPESTAWWHGGLGLLVAHRLVVYVGGVAAIGSLWALDAVGVELPQSVRSTVVGVGLAVMLVTYLGELTVGRDGDDAVAGGSAGAYSARTKVVVSVAVLGIAAAVYLGLTGNLTGAAVFAVGSYLFARLGFGAGETAAGSERGTEGEVVSDRGP